MLGSINSKILRLRATALVASLGVVGMAACASSENVPFDDPEPVQDAGTKDVNTPDATADASDGAGGGSGDDAGAGGAGGDGGMGGAGGGTDEPDSCGGQICPEPTYPDFFKCCTTDDKCGYKNGPSGFCYESVPDDDPGQGVGGGGP